MLTRSVHHAQCTHALQPRKEEILIAVTRWAYAEVCTGTEQEGCTLAYIVGTQVASEDKNS